MSNNQKNDHNNDYINYLLFLFADLHILAKSILIEINSIKSF
jgi:hypothetical protein